MEIILDHRRDRGFRGEGCLDQRRGATVVADQLQADRQVVTRQPHGSEIAGWPDRLNGCVQRNISARTASGPPLTGMVAAPSGGAGMASEGNASTSTPLERAINFAGDHRLAAHRADVILGKHVARHFEAQATGVV